MTGVEMIAAERERQITEERYTPTHDRTHSNEALARAASVYALPPPWRTFERTNGLWPNGWRFTGAIRTATAPVRIRELVKAGALIAAEIDRLGTGDRG